MQQAEASQEVVAGISKGDPGPITAEKRAHMEKLRDLLNRVLDSV
jgi:hypothetical protein